MSNEELSNVIDRAEDEYQKLKDKVIEQGLEIERLNNIIKEVKEYIESYMPNYDFDKTNLIKLLEILGSDKE